MSSGRSGARPAAPNQPPSLAHRRRPRRLAAAARVALAEQRLDRAARIGVEGGARRVEVLLVVEVIVPLADRVRVGRIDGAVDERHADSRCAKPSGRYGTHRLATPCTRAGWCCAMLQTIGAPQSWPTQNAARGRASRAARSCRRRSARPHSPRVAGARSSGRSRACRGRWRGSRARRSSGSWCRQLIDSSGQPCTKTISGASAAPHAR